MASITIVINDLPKGKGCSVTTNAAPPAIGQPRSPADTLAMDLLRVCAKQATIVTYGSESAALVGEMVRAEAEAGRGQITIHHDGKEFSAAYLLASSPLKG